MSATPPSGYAPAVTETMPTTEKEAEGLAGRKAYAAFAAILAVSVFVEANSLVFEWRREGAGVPELKAWLLEASSALLFLALFPAVRWAEKRWAVDGAVTPVTVGIHLAASVLWSLLHVAGMVLLREVLWLVIWREHYSAFAEVLSEFVYEYRKDAMTYGLALLLLYLFRSREFARFEARVARRDAQATRQLSLKCGGRTIYVDAASFDHARAAGNYVEVSAGGATHLVRMTLKELARQLEEAGADPLRVHRSWLVRRGAIAEVAPDGEGSVQIRLASGVTVPGSRTYRAAVETV